MDEGVQRALKVYGNYLEGQSARMNETVINAIRTIRGCVYLRKPDDQDIQHAIVTAKRKGLSGAELESLIMQCA